MEMVRVQSALLQRSRVPTGTLRHCASRQYRSVSRRLASELVRTARNSSSASPEARTSFPSFPPCTNTQLRAYSTGTPIPEDALPARTTVEQASDLLARSRSRVESQRWSVSERRKLAAHEQLGTRTLRWMMQMQNLDSTHTSPKQLCFDVCWFLVAEGRDQTLTDWLIEEAFRLISWFDRHSGSFRQSYNQENEMGRRLRRRHDLLSGLVRARIELSLDGTADDAINCLLSMFTIASTNHMRHAFPWAGALMSVQRALIGDECKPCDPGLFDQFGKVMEGLWTSKNYERETAWLMLYHPTWPDARLALKQIMNELENRMIWTHTQKTRTGLGHKVLRALYILELQGISPEATWAQATMKEEFGAVWRNRHHAYARFENDPRLDNLRAAAQATPLEFVPDDRSSRGRDLPDPGDDVTSELLAIRTRTIEPAAGLLRNHQQVSAHPAKGDSRTTRRSYHVYVASPRLPIGHRADTGTLTKTFATCATLASSRYNLPRDEAIDQVSQVGKLLADLRAEVDSSQLSFSEQRKLASKPQLGTRALQWLMKLEGLDEEQVLPKRMCNDLAWVLVAETKEASLIDWLMVEAERMKPKYRGKLFLLRRVYNEASKSGRQLRRRHDLTCGIVEARLSWSGDKTANDAIESICALVSIAKQRRVLSMFPLAGATTILSRNLHNVTCAPCDSDLYDKLWDLMRHFGRNPNLYAFARLYHPTSPDPWPALKVLKAAISEKDFGIMKPAAMNHYGHELLRTIFLLNLQGATAEALQYESILEDRFPAVWYHRARAWNEIRQDPKLQHLIHQGGNDVAELEQGRTYGVPAKEDEVISDLLAARTYRNR